MTWQVFGVVVFLFTLFYTISIMPDFEQTNTDDEVGG